MTLPVLDALKSQYHIDAINNKFLKYVLLVQGGFTLVAEDEEKALSVLRMSPTALLWAIQPNDMMVKHRVDRVFDAEKQKTISDPFCRNYFLWNLYNRFRHDFRNPYLTETFHEFHGIRELESVLDIKAKSHEGILFQGRATERNVIGRLMPGFVNPAGIPWAHMLALESAPQPWESTEDQADKE
jgi:hypothetical protein